MSSTPIRKNGLGVPPPDGKTHASVVVTDPTQSLELRNEAARLALQESDATESSLFVRKGIAFTVPYTLKVVGPEALAQQAEKIVLSSFEECNAHLNYFNPQSELSVINRCADTEKIHSLSDVMVETLHICYLAFKSTGGVFNPAYPGLSREVKKLHEKGVSPSLQDLQKTVSQCAPYATLRAFDFDSKHKQLRKKDPRAVLDLGGISKGYAVDRAIAKLSESGIENCFLDWGGDIKVLGKNQQKKPWRVGVIRPPSLAALETGDQSYRDSAQCAYLRVAELEDGEAMATSGDYEHPWRSSAGTCYSHHFDVRSGAFLLPSERSVAQISVTSVSCATADALSTSCLAFAGGVPSIRTYLDRCRQGKYAVKDFTTYIRHDHVVAQMHQTATEDADMKKKRVALSLPAKVVVVGGGLAGVSAAIEAANCGASVLLVEKTGNLGGNSAKATSGINGWGTAAQNQREVYDEGMFFERDTYVSGKGGSCGTGLVQVLSIQSRGAIQWLSKEFGVPLSVVSQLGGHSRPRTHRAPDKPDGTPVPIGFAIMKQMTKAVESPPFSSKISVLKNTSIVRFMTAKLPNGQQKIEGIVLRSKGAEGEKDEEIEYRCDSVVLATGGFSSDRGASSLMQEFRAPLDGMPTTNGDFATGDGVKVARSVGARLVDMDKVQLHPTGLLDPKKPANSTKFLGPEALRGSGGILLNEKGKRFVNELELRSVVSKAILDQDCEYPGSNGCRVAYCVLSPAAVTLFGRGFLNFYKDRLKLFQEVPDVKSLAELLKVSEETLHQTLADYHRCSSTRMRCPLTGKRIYPCAMGPNDGPFTVAVVTPTIHYTMGGLAITPAGEVLDGEQQQDERRLSRKQPSRQGTTSSQIESPMSNNDTLNYGPGVLAAHGMSRHRTILGLFAAGEVTGGLHGNNRLAGNSLLECVVFGRIAGDRAATILQRHSTALSTNSWSPVVLQEVRGGEAFGHGSNVLRFNLPGCLQRSGLQLGQYVSVSGEWDGEQLVGHYSPISLPQKLGVIDILVRVDKGPLKEWIKCLKPGDAVLMKGCGGLTLLPDKETQTKWTLDGRPISKLAMIAGGSGIAPMLQLMKACLKRPYCDSISSLHLLYAADEESELSYGNILRAFQRKAAKDTVGVKFDCNFYLSDPPPGWTEGVGYIDQNDLVAHIPPPSPELAVVICGPPAMQREMIRILHENLGYPLESVRTFDEGHTGGQP